jgi:hypothetical protein
MKKIIAFIFVLNFFTQCISQKKQFKLICNGAILDVKIQIKGISFCSQCDLAADKLINGFELFVPDSSYKIIGFQLIYTNNKNEVSVSDIKGNVVNRKNFKNLINIKPGNSIGLECINIEKNGIVDISTNMTIFISN